MKLREGKFVLVQLVCLNTADYEQSKNSLVGLNIKAPSGCRIGLFLFRAKVWESSKGGYCRWGSE